MWGETLRGLQKDRMEQERLIKYLKSSLWDETFPLHQVDSANSLQCMEIWLWNCRFNVLETLLTRSMNSKNKKSLDGHSSPAVNGVASGKSGDGPCCNQPHKWCAFKKTTVKLPKFEGKCDILSRYIYNCSNSRQADIFSRTTKEIAEYAGPPISLATTSNLVGSSEGAANLPLVWIAGLIASCVAWGSGFLVSFDFFLEQPSLANKNLVLHTHC